MCKHRSGPFVIEEEKNAILLLAFFLLLSLFIWLLPFHFDCEIQERVSKIDVT